MHELAPSAVVAEHAFAVFPEPDTLMVGVTPEMGLEFASSSVIETVAKSEPFAVGVPDTEISVVEAEASPAMKVFELVIEPNPVGVEKLTVLFSALVVVVVHVEMPVEAFDELHDVVFPVPVTDNVGVVPPIGFE